MKIKNTLIRSISALIFAGATVTGGGVLAYTNANVNKLELLTRAVRDDTVEQLQAKSNGIQIAMGSYHSAAVIEGTLYTWGHNNAGQLGLGTTDQVIKPKQVTHTNKGAIIPGTVTQIALGFAHSAAVINGALYTWGSNTNGRLGLGDFNSRNIPTQVTTTSNGAIGIVTEMALGRIHSAAVINGTLYTWGANGFGQLGLGDKTDRNIPTKVINSSNGIIAPKTITKIALGAKHSSAIIDGALYTWGYNIFGQLGLGTTDRVIIPTQVKTTTNGAIAPKTVTQIALGDEHSAAVIEGALYTWGYNNFGQLGFGDETQRNTPTQITQLPSGPITQIAIGGNHSAAMINDALYTWGSNSYGQLGIGNSSLPQTIPTKVINSSNGIIAPKTITKIALGGNHSSAIIDGALYTWGYNIFGQLGLGDTKDRYIPTQVDKIILPTIKDTINLDDTNDQDGISRKIIAYNLVPNDIETILKYPNINIDNLDPLLAFSNIVIKSRLGSTSNGTPNTGQAIVTFENNSRDFEVVINGFLHVNLTETSINDRWLPGQAQTFFENDEINELVADANNPTTGQNSKLVRWINDNNPAITDTIDKLYSENFPKDTKITKISDIKVTSGINGAISFKIQVDKYYKQSGSDLVVSSGPGLIDLTNPITLSGFRRTNESIPKVRTNIDPIKNINATQLLALFGNTNNVITGTGLTNLKKYIDLSSFPTTAPIATFKIIKPSLNGTSLSFQIEATGYYDDNGILSTGSKTYPELTIDNLLDSQSKIEKKLGDVTTPPKVILQNIGYDSTNTVKPVNEDKLKDYVNLISFPSNTTYTLINVNDTNPTELSFKVVASKQTDSSGATLGEFTSNLITFINLDPGITTSIKVRSDYPKNILAGDVEKSFTIDKLDGSFNKDAIDDYVVFKGEVTNNETYTIDKYNRTHGTITFDIVASQTMDGGVLSTTSKAFHIELTGLRTIANSLEAPFLRKNIIGNDNFNGSVIANQIHANIEKGVDIKNDNTPLWNLWKNLVDIDIYPPGTKFTIISIVMHNKMVFKTFDIKFTASNYYEDNTTMNVPAPQEQDIHVNNIKYYPTKAVNNTQAIPDIKSYQFLGYIEYDELNGAFNARKLQEFITLTSFDLSVPGTTTKLVNPMIEDNHISFELEVLNYIDHNGIGQSNSFNLHQISVVLKLSVPDNHGTSNSQEDNSLGIILGVFGGFALLLLIIVLLVLRHKNKNIYRTD